MGINIERDEVLMCLPIKGCKYETNGFGDEGWRAPEGFGFKISGQFIEEHVGSVIRRPINEARLSKDLLLVNGVEEMNSDNPPPEEFIGTWMNVVDGVQSVGIWIKQDKVHDGNGGWIQNFASGSWRFCRLELVPTGVY